MKLPTLAAWPALLAGALLALSVHAQAPAKPEPGPGPDPKILDDIADCLAVGLPQDWKKAWFVISEVGRDERSATRTFEANFFYATDPADNTGKRLNTCGSQQIVEGVKALNAYLPEDQQRWTGALFVFMSDGKFEAKYDYSEFKAKGAADAAPAKAAEKPAAKPQARSTAKKKPDAAK